MSTYRVKNGNYISDESIVHNGEALNTYLNKLNSYISDEIEVGKWINGDKLYKKYISSNFNIANAYGNFYLDIFESPSEIDKCWIGSNGYIIDGNELVPLNFVYQGSSSFFSTVMTSIENKKLRVHSSAQRTNQTIVAEVYYTKV